MANAPSEAGRHEAPECRGGEVGVHSPVVGYPAEMCLNFTCKAVHFDAIWRRFINFWGRQKDTIAKVIFI